MKQLYYIHANSHFTYCITIWGTDNHNATYMQPLIRAQKKLIRIIKRLPPRAHTQPTMQKLSILNLPNLYTLRVGAEMHPFIHNNDKEQKQRPNHNHEYTAIKDIHTHSTRYATKNHQYIPNPHNYSKTRKSVHTRTHLTSRYTDIWNSFPEEIRNTSSLKKFKSDLKSYLLTLQLNEELTIASTNKILS
jgi:hypothetical protein